MSDYWKAFLLWNGFLTVAGAVWGYERLLETLSSLAYALYLLEGVDIYIGLSIFAVSLFAMFVIFAIPDMMRGRFNPCTPDQM
jgi:hypothetical protein